MTEVAFHFNVPDKMGYTCRLLRKAVATGARVVVTADGATLDALDVALWTFSELDFIAHCRLPEASAGVLDRSPVVLADAPQGAPHQQVLLNLGHEVPEGFERFERLIEVVCAEPQDREIGRRRWKHYRDRGYAIEQHDRAGRQDA